MSEPTASEQAPKVTPWEVIEAHLIAAGHLSPEGVGRRAQPRRCRTCGASVLVGLDADWASTRAEADPRPVDKVGEMLAVLEGRRTYALVSNRGRIVLDYRDSGRITHRPAGTPRMDVLTQHRCPTSTTPPTRFPRLESFLTRTQPHHLPEGSACPF